ncbi:MAG: transferrin-binding protein-like solute binding protein [Alphaproteobacteria bacterium]|nr:transferrin-binding protein-like solute binding protein [Alphaproteobacteria bacterium]
MSTSAFHNGMVALPLVAMLALAGCGGGGGGGSTSMAPGGPKTPEPPTEQVLIERAIERAETARATAMSAAEDAADDCAFLSSACTDADTAAAAVTAAETALDDAREATTSALAETAATAAETAATTATTALTATQQAVNAPVGPAPAAGMATDGLASSAAPKITATDATTLESLFSTQPNNQYSALSGALKRDFNAGTASLDGVLHVHTVQRTSTGGYVIVYTDGQTQHTIEFGSEHCRPGYCEIRGNGYHGFWAWEAADNEPLGPPRFWHIHALNLIANPTGSEESRIAFVFGLKTPPATLQTLGEAVYNGWFRSDAYRAGDNSSSLRQRYSGNLRIVANFDISRLYGTIVGVRGSEPGSSTRNPLPTSSFSISEGEIHDNGQFTATLTGMDSDASVADKDSVRGVMGQILGEFYGREGRSLAGVVTGSRDLAGDANDLVFYGYIRGGKLGPTVSLAADALVAGIDRDNVTNKSDLLSDDGMARVERTADGWSVTVDGRSVTFDDTDDFNIDSRYQNAYSKVIGPDSSALLWTQTGGFGFGRQFDHFDVKGWVYVTWAAGADPATADFEPNFVHANQVSVLHGNRTPAVDVPASGTATYAGRMNARDVPTDDAISTNNRLATYYRGEATLTAAFGSSSVAGRLSNLESRPGDNSSNYAGVQGELAFDATINGNLFTASSVAGTQDMAGYQAGSVRGAFFGPAAEEAGAVFDAIDTGNNRAMFGWLGGDQQ